MGKFDRNLFTALGAAAVLVLATPVTAQDAESAVPPADPIAELLIQSAGDEEGAEETAPAVTDTDGADDVDESLFVVTGRKTAPAPDENQSDENETLENTDTASEESEDAEPAGDDSEVTVTEPKPVDDKTGDENDATPANAEETSEDASVEPAEADDVNNDDTAPADQPTEVDDATDELADEGDANDRENKPLPENKAAPPLWRVSDEDSTYWLFGTFHILPPALDWRTPELGEILEGADRYYFEVEGDARDAQSRTLSVLMSEGFNPPGTLLSDLLEDKDAKKLKEVAGKLKMPMAAIDSMRPWQAFLALSVEFIVSKGFEPGKGADNILMNEARTRSKELRFLESIEQQLGFFSNLPSETETELLTLTLQDWEAQDEGFDDLYNAWRIGDIDVIDDAMNASLRDQAPEVFDVLIVERNKAWAKTIAADMRESEGDALVAVGAAHMAGEALSLPALLEAEGFVVSRVVHGFGNDD